MTTRQPGSGDNRRMKRLGIVVAWAAATFLTAMVAWSAVNLAGDQVSDRPVLPLSPAEVEALPVAPTTQPNPLPATTAPVATTTAAAAPATTTTTAPPSTTTSSVAPPSSTSTTTSTSSTTTTTTTTVPAAETSVYQLVGGVVSIESAPGAVSLLSASPNAGFSVEVKSRGPGAVEVEFESSGHESTLTATWDGMLIVDVDEEPGDDDD